MKLTLNSIIANSSAHCRKPGYVSCQTAAHLVIKLFTVTDQTLRVSTKRSDVVTRHDILIRKVDCAASPDPSWNSF